MLKQLTLISLSLAAISCGQKNTTGPDAILVVPSLSLSKTQATGWRSPGVTNVTIFHSGMGKRLSPKNGFELYQADFYKQFKSQYKSPVVGASVLDLENVWFFESGDFQAVHFVSLAMDTPEPLKSLTLHFFPLENPGIYKEIKLADPKKKNDLAVDLSKLTGSVGPLAVKIADYSYLEQGKIRNHKEELKESLRTHYRLHIDSAKERRTHFVAAGTKLSEALAQLEVPFRESRDGRIANFQGKESYSINKIDINDLPDDSGFWRLINSPGQTLDFSPIPGQDVVIKRITMGELRDRVAEKVSTKIKSDGSKLPMPKADKVDKRILRDITSVTMVPYVMQEKVQAQAYYVSFSQSSNSKVPKPVSCHVYRYKRIGYKRLESPGAGKLLSSHLISTKGDEFTVSLHAKNVGFDLGGKSYNLRLGYKNIDCPNRTLIKHKKEYANFTKWEGKIVRDRRFVEAELVDRMKL